MADAPPIPRRDQRTKLELLRGALGYVAATPGPGGSSSAVDSAYAGRTVLEQRPPNVDVVGPGCAGDAALWAPRPQAPPLPKGRPRRAAARLPTPQQVAARCRHWPALTVTIPGQTVATEHSAQVRALWYAALHPQPVAIVLVRDPTGKRRDEAFFCTDPTAEAAVHPGSLRPAVPPGVTFHDAKQFLGFAEPRCPTPRAVQRTAPFALLVYDLVLLSLRGITCRRRLTQTSPVRPWYRHKTAPSFADMLAALRGTLGPPRFGEPRAPHGGPQTHLLPRGTRGGLGRLMAEVAVASCERGPGVALREGDRHLPIAAGC